MKALLTLPESFYNGYPQFDKKLEDLGLTVQKIISDVPVEKSIIMENIKDADIYVLAVESVDEEVIAAAKNLKMIVKPAAGYDNIDIAKATQRGIPVTFAPGLNAVSVADLTLALLLAAARRVPQSNTITKSGGWQLLMGTELDGKTLGILGFGNIGKMVAKRAAGFGMNLLAFDAFQDTKAAKELGVTFCDLDDLLAQSDFISINLALTEETRGLLDQSKLRIMKQNAVIVNTSRGPVINEADLIEALKNGVIAGAALDVFNSEPPNPELVSLDNVIATSHIGGSTYACAERMYELSIENIRRFISGEELLNVINPEALQTDRKQKAK